jgi:hypothetical protein
MQVLSLGGPPTKYLGTEILGIGGSDARRLSCCSDRMLYTTAFASHLARDDPWHFGAVPVVQEL